MLTAWFPASWSPRTGLPSTPTTTNGVSQHHLPLLSSARVLLMCVCALDMYVQVCACVRARSHVGSENTPYMAIMVKRQVCTG
eukprot:scaffold181968_cov21-Tisochrysis_lutea.AAC.1